MRRDLHAEMQVPALYIAVPAATPFPCTVRQHDKPEVMTVTPGTTQTGLAQAQITSDRLIFITDDAPPLIRNNAVVSIAPGVAYRINHTHPAHDITITAEVTRLSAAEAAGLPVPSAS